MRLYNYNQDNLQMNQKINENSIEPSNNLNKQEIIPIVDVQNKKSKKNKNITIDLKNTQYKILREVAEKMLWKISQKKQSSTQHNQQSNLIWTDFYISEDQLRNLLPYQKINHFPSSFQLGNKHYLAKNILKMKKKFKEDYDFFPETWLMPDDFERFKCQQQKLKNTWIFKPSNSSQGKGIIITKNLDVIEQKIKSSKKNTQFIIQKYISNPYLIQGLKFDLRIYVLIKSIFPLKIYMYKQGLARFATNNYEKPQKSNMKNNFMHLTNYAINKKNPNFSFSQVCQNQGHKRTYSSILKILESKGHDTNKFQHQLHNLIVKTICSVQPLLSHLYKTSTPNRQNPYYQSCFQILGFDILIDQNLKPNLLQVNHTPSFRTDSAIDYQVKFNLIKDTLIIIDVNPKQKTRYQESKSKISKIDNKSRLININKVYKKQKHSQNGYHQIYPTQDIHDQYKKYMQYSHLLFDLWTGIVKNNSAEIINTSISSTNKNSIRKISNFQCSSDKKNVDKANDIKLNLKKEQDIKNIMYKSQAQFSNQQYQNQQRENFNRNNFITLHKKSRQIMIIQDISFNFSKRYEQKFDEQSCYHNFLEKKSVSANKKPLEDTKSDFFETFYNRSKAKIFTKRQYLSKVKLSSGLNHKKLKVIQFPIE